MVMLAYGMGLGSGKEETPTGTAAERARSSEFVAW